MKRIVFLVLASTFVLTMSALAMTLPWDDLGYNTAQGWETFTWSRQLVRGDAIPPGQGPTVYIIDGGVGVHEDLPTVVARVNPGNPHVSAVGCYPHATHVAGIIGAQVGNGGVAGIAAGARMISVSVLVRDAGTGANRCADSDNDPAPAITDSSVLAALTWVKTHIQQEGSDRTAVVNISMNHERYASDPAIKQALWELTQPIGNSKGALVVQSAGNNGGSACARSYNVSGTSLKSDGVMVVGAIRARPAPYLAVSFDNYGTFEPGSNSGPCVDIYAPGTKIYSTYANQCPGSQVESPPVPYSGYCYLEGTSMAAPHVTGIAARLLKDEPRLSPGDLETRIRNLSLNVGTFDAPLFVARLPSYDDDNDSLPNFAEPLKQRNPGMKDNNIFASNPAFVEQQYRDFWDRERDPSDQQLNQLDAGTATRAQVIDTFLRSAEHYDTRVPIVRLYLACFLRFPDYGGLRFWVGEYQHKHWTLDGIANFFASSTEFLNTYGSLSNAAFVDLVYWNVLGRAPDPGGRAFWIGELDSFRRTRGQVMLAFSESQEYRTLSGNEVYVTLAYAALLRRAPDSSGGPWWVGQLDGGVPGTTLTNAFYHSWEYYYRFLP